MSNFPEMEYKAVEEVIVLPENGTSLSSLQQVYRNPSLPLLTRIRAATAALPHKHPKLAVTATVTAGDFADQLEKANERSRRVLLEAKPMIEANVSDTANVSSDIKPGTSTVPDRRFRRW